MNVCILTHIFPARSETFIREHAVGMRRRGHQVSVIARTRDPIVSNAEVSELDAMGIQRFYVGDLASPKLNRIRAWLVEIRFPHLPKLATNVSSDRRRRWLVAAAECSAIRSVSPDVVHVHFGDHANHLLRMTNEVFDLPPCVVTWHGYDVNAIPRRDGERVYDSLFASSATHTCGSNFIVRRLLALGAQQDRIHRIPMGIDLNKFVYRVRPVTDPAEPLRLLSVGRLDDVKGHRYLIDALKLLNDKGTRVVLRIAGDGPLRNALESQISNLDASKYVTLLGAIPSGVVSMEMHAADVFALTGIESSTGKVESQGVVYAEAQATGLPVIATAVGGAPESLVDGQTGILCSPGDVSRIASAIEGLARSHSRRLDLGTSGRRFVEENFSTERMLDRFEGVYSRLLSRN